MIVAMEIADLLQVLVSKIDGALAAALGSMDGLIIEQYPAKGQNLASLIAEEASLLLAARKAYQRSLPKLAHSHVVELMFSTEKLSCYAQLIDEDVFCLVLLRFSHDQKALREQLRRFRPEFIKVLNA
ncbi:MAG: hypothetical protein R2880_00120 [Deinococcales bacterium]